MAISNYIRPQTEIYQQLEITLEVTHGYLAACVIGPQYDLYRYGKEELPAIPLSTEEQTIPFTYSKDRLNDYEVDLDSITVFAEDIQASLATFDGTELEIDPDDRYVLRLKTNGSERPLCFASVQASRIAPKLKRYGVQISDVVAVTAKDKSVKDDPGTQRVCNVIDLVGVKIPAHVEVSKDAKDVMELVSGADSYTGDADTAFNFVVAEVEEDGSSVFIEVTDTEGVGVAQYLQIDSEGKVYAAGEEMSDRIVDIGLGIKVQFKDDIFEQLVLGSVFTVSAVAVSEDPDHYNGLRLDSMPVLASIAPENLELVEADIRLNFSGEVPGASQFSSMYSVSEEGVTFPEELSVYVPDQKGYAPFVNGVGNFYIQFRVLVMPKDEEEDIFYLETEEDITNNFGPIDQLNDLAYAAYTCLKGASGRAIYALRVSGRPDDQEAYLNALRKTQSDRTCYSFAAVTPDFNVAHAVSLWNEEQCAPDMKNYRRTIYGIEDPGLYASATVDKDGLPIYAVFVGEDGNTNTNNATLVQLSPEVRFNFRDYKYNEVATMVRPGDFVKLNLTGAMYEVKRVTSKTELELVNGPKSEITTATAITIYKAATAANMTEYIQGTCARFGNRRATVVFCDGGMYEDEVIANKYLAAYVAGLSSAVVPQKSITRSEVTAITSAPRMYTKYTRKQLDDIARYGCLLITQDLKNAPCYVRHQLTTETDKGLLYYEESCTRNVDNISFAIDEVVDKFIGHANVTHSALIELKRVVSEKLDEFMADATDPLVGPSLIDYSDLTVRQDPVYKDRVNINVNLYIPAPLNNIRVFEKVYAAEINIED